MISFGTLLGAIIIIWVFMYTISYGSWTWKRKNKWGAIMIFLLALFVIVIPVYVMYINV